MGLGDLGRLVPGRALGRHAERVGVARALVTDPEIMLFDEPFSALDPLIRRDMQDEVIRLQRRRGRRCLHHPRPARGPAAGRPHRDHEGRRDRPAGHAGGARGLPADDYVDDFISDVPRRHVLTVRTIMRAPEPGEEGEGPELGVATTVRDAVPVLAGSEKPVHGMQDGRVVGIVDRVAVLKAIAGEGG